MLLLEKFLNAFRKGFTLYSFLLYVQFAIFEKFSSPLPPSETRYCDRAVSHTPVATGRFTPASNNKRKNTVAFAHTLEIRSPADFHTFSGVCDGKSNLPAAIGVCETTLRVHIRTGPKLSQFFLLYPILKFVL